MKSGTSVEDVAKLMKVKDDDIALFVSPKLTALKSYLRLFNHKNDADDTLVNALVAGFHGEDKLASMLLAAKRNTRFEEKATKLQNAQFNQWLYDDIDPSNVLTKIFKLEREKWHLATDIQKSIAHQFNTFWLKADKSVDDVFQLIKREVNE
ncbi:Avirulence (Avh) protein [Phytophthora megakarya]|uniref:Avirulence (Avh) protein n=1 Tax=Phytophthora megakarya TaxID=4795 RepID=A0A225VRU4_9STRA|nr:Avirulence (Avh) protein [Phytophthora megakarya]